MPESVSSGYTGLYYPYSHFPEKWVKVAALYWDSIARIVPSGYQFNDSETVKRLKGEDIIGDYPPTWEDINPVSSMFYEFIETYGDDLELYYNVFSTDRTSRDSIYRAKMLPELCERLIGKGLAVEREDENGEGQQVELHPKLYLIYMEALAEQVARNRKLWHPVADNLRDHVPVGGYTIGRLAQALLESNDGLPHLAGPTRRVDEAECKMATIALEAVLPENIEHVPIQKIIQLRNNYGEFTAFQKAIHELMPKCTEILQIPDPQARDQELRQIYRREIAPKQEELRRRLNSLALGTVTGVLNVRITIPPFLAGAATVFHINPIPPVIVGTAAIAHSVIPVFKSTRREMREQVEASPEISYLLHIQEDSTTDLVTQVVQRTRRLLFGV